MNWKIPHISGQPLPICVEPGGNVFIVGANGSGKSALIQQLVTSHRSEPIRRISAHRQTWLASGSLSLTARQRRDLGQKTTRDEFDDSARWVDTNGPRKQQIALFDLVAKENDRARRITQLVDSQNLDQAANFAAGLRPYFDQLNQLLALATLSITLQNSNDEEIMAFHRDSSSPFSFAQMSDGERNAGIIAATVLTMDPGTVLLIDEPERHLHRAIIEPFLSALFDCRKDCAFIIATHELTLPISSSEASVLMVRSCQWSGDSAIAWDVDVLEAGAELPEELKLAILGSRRRILFVEGTLSSLDLPLYHALFPDISVIAKGTSTDVLRAVSGLKESSDLHHVDVYGLIDRDERTDEDVSKLAALGVFALNLCCVESLYYCPDAISAVARRQAESLGRDPIAMYQSAVQAALDAINDDSLAERMAAKRCEGQIRNQMMAKIPDWEFIRDYPTSPLNVSIKSPYQDELALFKKLAEKANLGELIARYKLRESEVFHTISRALGLTGRPAYQQTLISRIRDDEVLAESLRGRIGPLSTALDAQSTPQANT